jgi:hypothetical protein
MNSWKTILSYRALLICLDCPIVPLKSAVDLPFDMLAVSLDLEFSKVKVSPTDFDLLALGFFVPENLD